MLFFFPGKQLQHKQAVVTVKIMIEGVVCIQGLLCAAWPCIGNKGDSGDSNVSGDRPRTESPPLIMHTHL